MNPQSTSARPFIGTVVDHKLLDPARTLGISLAE